jgi:hypothetical protein
MRDRALMASWPTRSPTNSRLRKSCPKTYTLMTASFELGRDRALLTCGRHAAFLIFGWIVGKPEVESRHPPRPNRTRSIHQAACSRRICRCFRAASNFRSRSAWISC